MRTLTLIFTIIIITLSVAIHESAHALTAYILGDDTAKKLGRITLNPLKHFDPLGAVMLLSVVVAGWGIGWGKPVPVNVDRLKSPARDELIIALAGPFSNFLQAAVFAALLKSGLLTSYSMGIAMIGFTINISLMLFNLIPLPPLDGSKIYGVFLPVIWRDYRREIETYGGFVLLFIIFFARDFLSDIITPFYKALQNLFF